MIESGKKAPLSIGTAGIGSVTSASTPFRR
jgi:hypothetical protein